MEINKLKEISKMENRIYYSEMSTIQRNEYIQYHEELKSSIGNGNIPIALLEKVQDMEDDIEGITKDFIQNAVLHVKYLSDRDFIKDVIQMLIQENEDELNDQD